MGGLEFHWRFEQRPYTLEIGGEVASPCATKRKLIVVALSLAVILTFACECTFGGSAGDRETRSLLQNCLKSQRVMDRVSMKVKTEINLLSGQENKPRQQRDQLVYRRDGNRLDIAGRHLYVDQREKDSYQYRVVINKKYFIYYTFEFSKFERPELVGTVSTNRRKFLERFVVSGSSVLDGFFYVSGGKRFAQLMLDADNLRMRPQDTIDGTACKVVEGETPYGKIVLWIAPAKGFNALKVLYEKDANHLYDNKPLSEGAEYDAKGQKVGIRKWSITLDNVSVSEIGNAWIPLSGRLSKTISLVNGGKTITEFTYNRSAVDINPTFRGTDAFVTDLPDGSRVTNVDDPNSGVIYRWRNGEVVPAYSALEGDDGGFLGGRSFWVVVIWSILGMLVAGFGGWMLIHFKFRRSS